MEYLYLKPYFFM